MSIVIGVTGPSGTGKSTVCAYFSKFNSRIIDADHVAREVVQVGSPCLQALSVAFTNEILLADGSLNRKKLGRIVFSDTEKLNILNNIIFPYIIENIQDKISKYKKEGVDYIILDAPTLFESGADKQCDYIICVLAEKHIRKQRIMQRDHLSYEEAVLRIEAQNPDFFYIEKSDFQITNNNDKENLFWEMENILSKIKGNPNDSKEN